MPVDAVILRFNYEVTEAHNALANQISSELGIAQLA